MSMLRRRRFRATLLLLAGLALCLGPTLGGVASASPRRGGSYAGVGKDYLNDSLHWATFKGVPLGRFSFKVSPSGRELEAFRGTFYYYCGNGVATVVARTIAVDAAGAFGYRFSVPSVGPNKKVNGREYVSISGDFIGNGLRARVAYLVDYVGTGQKVARPYDTGTLHELGCASWVRGVAKAS